MKKLYEKSEITFAIVWIIAYSILNSVANPLSAKIGVEHSAHMIFNVIMTVVLFVWIKKTGLMKKYGLCKSSLPASRFLFYIPLIAVATQNLWCGVALNFSLTGTICYVASMLAVGFLEEVIFRGLLFRAIEKDSVKTAIIISSVTFGIGHILNLINGSGAGLLENILQVVGAVAVGFLFVVIFYRGGSLIPCILTHSAINGASAFANDAVITDEVRLWLFAIRLVIIVGYTLILLKTLPKKQSAAADGEAAEARHLA